MDSRTASSSRAGFPPESGGPLGVGALWRAPLGDPPENPADPPMLLGRLEVPAAVDADYGQALGVVKDLASARAWLDAQEAKYVTRMLDLQTERIHGGRGDLGFAHTLTGTEIAAALHLPERTAGSLIDHSELLTRHYQVALTALQDGRLSRPHAWAVVEEATSIPDAAPEVLAAFEKRLVGMACKTTVSRFCQQAHRLREKLHPDSITTRHKKAAKGRLLQLNPAHDGMAWLEAYLPVTHAAGIFHR
ncbi:DUF222 domain-containing protein, partial [Arthrobacter sp. H20]|uniref:DUF222 domain-containing protein n=1 Tax=Arthrobacter sp. H20 TaxID=1267981 RepID=UPI0012DE8881